MSAAETVDYAEIDGELLDALERRAVARTGDSLARMFDGSPADRVNVTGNGRPAPAAPTIEPANLGEPLALDFDSEPEPPDWHVERVFERGTVNLLSGDTGSAKSIVAAALAIAAVTGGEWLGRQVAPSRVLYVDEENPERLIRRRLRALGMTNEDRDELRYYLRQGLALDDPQTLVALRGVIESESIGLLIVDTSTSATGADLNDNRAVANVFRRVRKVLGPLGVTVVILHHERKRRQDESYNSSQAAIGARAWANQADAHPTLTRMDRIAEVDADDLEPGHRRLRSTFRWEPDVKGRAGEVNGSELIAVESELDERSRYQWMRVRSEGSIEDRPAESDLAVRIARLLHAADGKMRRKQLATTLGEPRPEDPSGTFKRALSQSVEHAWVTDLGAGYYEAGESKPGQGF